MNNNYNANFNDYSIYLYSKRSGSMKHQILMDEDNEECYLCSVIPPTNRKYCPHCDSLFCEKCIISYVEQRGVCPQCDKILDATMLEHSTPENSPKRAKVLDERGSIHMVMVSGGSNISPKAQTEMKDELMDNKKAEIKDELMDTIADEDKENATVEPKADFPLDDSEKQDTNKEKDAEENDDLLVKLMPKDACSVHGHSVILYCSEDKVCICMACMMSPDHALHNFQNIEKVYNAELEEVERKIDVVQDYWKGLKEIVRQIEENLKNLETEERMVMGKVRLCIQEEARRLAEKKKNLNYEGLDMRKNHLRKVSMEVKQGLDKLANTVEILTKPQLIAAKKALQHEIYTLTKIPLKEYEHQVVPSDFTT